ncbi:MAG: hypothetical protein HY667_05170 [Chloroflexi bacterium]|nr:hypothetical protein [Chloroflexota bacterium]
MPEIKSAQEATERALEFIKKYRPFVRPMKAVKSDDTWLVEIDVGPIATRIAKLKLDVKSGDILEYSIPD